ncbi:MAG: M23 family metallopeptidase [Candidatus Dormibacteraceae bacterium]
MRRLFVALALALLVLGAAPVTADMSPDQQKALIDQIRAQLGSNLANAMAAQQELKVSLQQNAVQQQDVRAKITEVEAKIADLDEQIASAQRREAFLAQRITAERAQLRQLARAIYTQPSSLLVVLAEAHSLSDLLTRVADLNVAGARATEIKAQLGRDLVEIETERKKQQAAREEQVKLREQLATQLEQLRALQVQQERSVADLEEKIAQTQGELYLLNRQSAQLAQAVTDMLQQQQDAIIAAAMQAVWTQMQLWSQSNNVGVIPISAGHSTKYRFIWPEPQSQISQPFGPSPYPFEPPYGRYPHFHTGVDTVAPFGTQVLAADDGVVALVGTSSQGYGNYVILAHSGGLDTLYGHLATALVKVGDRVTQGQPVGLEGSTGNSTGAHLHFELRINQAPVDPTPYLPPGQPSPFRG